MPGTHFRPLDRMNRPENARQCLPVARIFFQTHQLSVQPVQVFTALQKKFANDLVVHSFFLHLFRFGTRHNRFPSPPAFLPIFLFSTHTIPFANARAPTFSVHPTFQHESSLNHLFRPSPPSLAALFSRHPFSFLQIPSLSAPLPPLRLYPFLPLLFLPLFNSAPPFHSGTPYFRFSN